jgi:hypothetical protein
MAFKKNLTGLSKKGRIDTQRGKGSTVQRTAPGERETLTGGSPAGRMMNRYPAAPQPPSNVNAPTLMQPPAAPVAPVPGGILPGTGGAGDPNA